MRASIVVITALFSALLVLMLGVSILVNDAYAITTELFCLLLLWIPLLLEIKNVIQFTWPIFLGIALALSLHSLGLVTNWYITIFWWDKLTHLISGVIIASFVATTMLIIDRVSDVVKVPIRWIPFICLISILTLEAFWEILEFSVDQGLGGNMQHGLQDTVNDILVNAFSGLVGGIIMAIYISRSSPGKYLSNLNADKIFKWLKKRYNNPERLR